MNSAINIVLWIVILTFFLKVMIQISIDKSLNSPFLGFDSYKFLLPLKKNNCSGSSDRLFSFANLLLKIFYLAFIGMSILIILYAVTVQK